MHRLLARLVLFTLVLLPAAAAAQPAPDRMRASLEGLQGFAVFVDLEGSVRVASSEALDVTVLTQQVLDRLVEAGLPASAPASAAPEGSAPYLYVHINTMEVGQGLVPFAITVQVFQPARLQRDSNLTMAASTWEHGVVGLVSQDRLPTISTAAMNLLEEFIADYRAMNL